MGIIGSRKTFVNHLDTSVSKCILYRFFFLCVCVKTFRLYLDQGFGEGKGNENGNFRWSNRLGPLDHLSFPFPFLSPNPWSKHDLSFMLSSLEEFLLSSKWNCWLPCIHHSSVKGNVAQILLLQFVVQVHPYIDGRESSPQPQTVITSVNSCNCSKVNFMFTSIFHYRIGSKLCYKLMSSWIARLLPKSL